MINLANRDDGLGLVTNIVLAISLAALGNAIIYSQGWDRSVGNVIQPSFAPPSYVLGIVWLFLFAFMGTARWLLIKSKSQKATYHSQRVIFLVVFCFLYPFYGCVAKIVSEQSIALNSRFLSNNSKKLRHKFCLCSHIAFFNALNLPFANYIHCLKSSRCSSCRVERTKSHSRLCQSLDESVILLHNIIQILHLPKLCCLR